MSCENPRKRGLGLRGRGGAKRPRQAFPQKHSLPRDDTETLRLTEKDLGITEYISTYPGFNGVIKQRFSDFLVNELKPDGSEVHLTNTKPPPEEVESKPSPEEMSDILPQEIWDQMNALLSQPSGSVEILVTEKSKDERRMIHQVVKKVFGHKLTSNTTEKDSDKYIKVIRSCNDNNKRNKGAPSWPYKRAEYVHFALYKENMDTMESINLLAHKLFMKPSLLAYAGTKDRRAKTCQRVSVKKVNPSKIVSAARALRGIAVGDFEFNEDALQLGQLAGNRFQIVLRNVTGTDEHIENAVTSLKQNGFINYYGLQRFGTQSVPTYHIGRALLQGNWQEAVELILKPRGPGESPNLQDMRRLWWKTRDAGQAFKLLRGRDKCIEGQLLAGLMKSHKNDLVNALENIPRNTRLMYLHSYQSYIWNMVLSRRIQEFGLEPVAGDLVLAEDAALVDTADPLLIPDQDATEQETEGCASMVASRLPAVKVLSESDVSKYSLHDIVLPLPGHEVTYPAHDAAKWYEELMAKDNLSSAALKLNIRKYCLAGTYRKIATLPSKVSWRVQTYSDATKPLVQSDLEIVQQKKPAEPDPNGSYRALILDFCLPSSSYATMALREVLKCDTSARHQTTLNSYCAVQSVPESTKSEPPSTETTESKVEPVKSETDGKPIKLEADVKPVKLETDEKLVKSETDVKPVKSETDVKSVKSETDEKPVKSETDDEAMSTE